MKTKLNLCMVAVSIVFYAATAWGFTEGSDNNFFGTSAGASTTTGFADTFMGASAGYFNTSGVANTFMGNSAGFSNTTGNYNTFMGYGAGFYNTTGYNNTFIGGDTGFYNTTGGQNTFMGYASGTFNTTGYNNTFIGYEAGFSNTTGNTNTFIGDGAGHSNTTGVYNTSIGNQAGYANTTGHGNVFLGASAGLSETGSNKLYIDNCNFDAGCTTPLIYGEFDTRSVRINGAGIGVIGYPPYTLDVSNMGVSESALHFSLSGTDTGGWITSVLGNNFFLSSGAAYDAVAGGWVQKSPDGKAVIAGSGSTGYRVQTRTGCAVGTVCSTPVTRLMIDYSGNVGLGLTAPLHPLHLAGGAYSDGANWINASSQEYKEDIESLSTEEALEAMKDLNPVKYASKADRTQRHVGFIAEDVPELVATKDRKGLSPMDIVAVLTKVVQEKSQLIEKLERALEAMEKRLSSLERQ